MINFKFIFYDQASERPIQEIEMSSKVADEPMDQPQ